MTTQTREHFLASGLVPVLSKDKADEECPICFCDIDDPVKTPCNHPTAFCRGCIEKWLKSPRHNSCPLCKKELFDLPMEEVTSPSAIRQRHIADALEASNLISRQPPFDNFGSTEYNISALMRAAANATYTLGRGPLPAPGEAVQLPEGVARVAGPCAIDAQNLSPAFVAMANLLPALAEAQGTPFGPWTPAWRTVCSTLWLQIKALDGRKLDAMVLPAQLKRKLRQAEGRAFLQYPMDAWLSMLLNWLTFTAWKLFQEKAKREERERETRGKRKEARREPKMRSLCGTM